MATGVLVLVIGEATKFSQFALDADKSYRTVVQLGIETDTLDADGVITNLSKVPSLSKEMIESVLHTLRGKIYQSPPAFSALKKNGERFYKLARNGVMAKPKARQVHVHDIKLTFLDILNSRLHLNIKCSKGTYIRSLAESIGRVIGSGAHVLSLERTQSGPFKLADCLSFFELKILSDKNFAGLSKIVLPCEVLVKDLAQVALDNSESCRLLTGQIVYREAIKMCHNVALFDKDGKFIGVGERFLDGSIKPRRMMTL